MASIWSAANQSVPQWSRSRERDRRASRGGGRSGHVCRNGAGLVKETGGGPVRLPVLDDRKGAAMEPVS